jgi:hypothetical protein
MLFDIISEPVDNTYQQLLAKCHAYSATVMLVVRDLDYLSPVACGLLERIHDWNIGKDKRSDWPGTIIKNFLATIYTYRCDPGLLTELQTVATRLYQWVQPELPEDLCFLRPDGSPILVSIAHERDAYLVLSQQEVNDLLVAVPALALRRRE